MTSSLIMASNFDGVAFSATRDLCAACTGLYNVTTANEALVKIKYYEPGVISNLAVTVSARSAGGTVTVRIRKNGANGNCARTITASTTGYFEDAVNTDSVASGDDINFRVAAVLGTCTITSISFIFTPTDTTKTVMVYASTELTNGYASIDTFNSLSEQTTGFSYTEAREQSRVNEAKTFKYIQGYLSSNDGGGITATLRKNGVDTALTVTKATGTGHFVNSTDEVSFSSGDLVNTEIVWGAGVGGTTIIPEFISVHAISTASQSDVISSSFAGLDSGAGADPIYIPIMGGGGVGVGTESYFACEINKACTVKKLSVYTESNASAGVITLRKNSADTALSVGIPTGTGRHENLYSSVDFSAGDTIDLSVTGSATFTTISLSFANQSATVNILGNTKILGKTLIL